MFGVVNFFDELNGLSADEILRRVKLDDAKDGKSYVCPLCGHGKGGDGIKPRTNDKGQTRWKCHGTCGTNFSNYDLCCAVLGLNVDDKAAALREMKELFGLDDGDERFLPSKWKSARAVGNDSEIQAMDAVKSAKEPRDFTKLYDYCRRNCSLQKFVAEQGGKWRGLTYDTLKAANCLYHGEYDFGDAKRPAIIFPYSKHFYFVRSVVDRERRVAKDAKRELYIAAQISLEYPNFVSEGEVDALSIAQVMKGYGPGSVATGGVGGARLLVEELNKRYANSNPKPSFIVCLDNDDSGEDNAPEFVKALRTAGYPAVFSFFEGEKAGTKIENIDTGEVTTIEKVDANDLLKRGGGELFNRLLDVLERSASSLDEQAATLKDAPDTEPLRERKKAVDVDGIASCSIAEYFTDIFALDVARTEQYAERKTGFENLDGGKLVLVPGLYLLGGLPAAGKTTFAWQLLNQLAEQGEYAVYCSYEMSRLELFAKSVSRELFKRKRAGQDVLTPTSFEVRSGRVKRVPEVIQAVKTFSFSKDQLHVAELSNMPVEKLFKWLEPRIASATKSPVIVVDYLQILPSGKDSKREGLDDTLRRLKDFQRSTDATFIVISSFNRQNYWSPVSFESFKESGGLEYSADVVLGLETFVPSTTKDDERKKAITEAARQPERTINLVCLKNRNGAPFTAQFKYCAAHDYFESMKDAEPTTARKITGKK